MMLRIPTIRLVEDQRDNGVPAYCYFFAYKYPAMGGALGSMHGLDNPFLFGSLDAQFAGLGPEIQDLAAKIHDSCASFARTGDPSCKTVGSWPVYGERRVTTVFDTTTRLERALYEQERYAWEEHDIPSADSYRLLSLLPAMPFLLGRPCICILGARGALTGVWSLMLRRECC